MKSKILFLLAVILFFSLSCVSAPKETWPLIEPESLIGTKWFSLNPDSETTLEFIGGSTCIYFFEGEYTPLLYAAKGSQIIFAGVVKYELKNNILYTRGNPVFTREAP
jgi:hypothetical protein